MKRCSNTHRTARVLAIAFGAGALLACATPSDRGGVQLPQGDPIRGREAFIALRCHACHEIAGFAAPAPPIVAASRVKLGEAASRPMTYADLVTSIANPAHELAPGYRPQDVAIEGVPLMTLIRLNEVMTVQQLVDVAAFLQAQYASAAP